jgi:hypothetical protein
MWLLLLALALDPRAAFEEARQICADDGGRLWGRSLCSPLLFADPQKGVLMASQPDRQGNLKPAGDGLWTGPLPRGLSPANTATDWAGVEWTMLVWPLPDDPVRRRRLLAHEMWHRLQPALMLPMSNAENPHLDTDQGRVWLRLELRALSAALQSAGDAQRQAVEDALAFRAERRRIFPNARAEEIMLENNEGLAEWTGYALDGAPREVKVKAVADQLRAERPSYVRSFAYLTGPAWGLLLDEASPGWNRHLGARSDIAGLLAEALKITPDPLIARERAPAYGGPAILQEEAARSRELAERQAKFRALFVEGPTLTLTLSERMQFAFNPNNLVRLPGYGTVYPTLRVTDDWGILNVTGGALMAPGWKSVTVALPQQGQGWTLELKPGWKRKPGPRRGDQVVSPAP